MFSVYLNNLDDWFILAQSEVEPLSHRTLLLSHLEHWGIRVNLAESALSHSQRVSFLGTVLDYGSLLGAFPPGTVPGTWHFFSTTSAEVPGDPYSYQNVVRFNLPPTVSTSSYPQVDGTGVSEPTPPDCSTAFSPRL